MRLIMFFLLFMCLYGPRLKIVDLMIFFCSGLAVLNILLLFTARKIPKLVLFITAYFAISLFYFSIHFLYFSTGDSTYLGFIVKYLIYLYAAEYIVYIYFKKYQNLYFEILVKDIVRATAINASFVILMFFLPSFKLYMADILNYERQLNWIETGHRIFDISLGGGASASFVFSLVFVLAIFIPKNSRDLDHIISMLLVAIGAALMGRTGLYIIIGTFLLVLVHRFFSMIMARKINYSFRVGELFSYLLLFVFFMVVSLYFFNLELLEGAYFNWVLEGFVGENKTANVLVNMWFMPDPTTSTLFGHGHFGRTEPNIIHSDVGYVRMMHATGLLGVLFGYSLFIFLLFFGMQSSKFVSSTSISMYWLFITLVSLVLLMNLKEYHLATRGTFIIIFIVFVSLHYSGFKVKRTGFS